jgi:Rad3-related DNA helicase
MEITKTTNPVSTGIMQHFPLQEARQSQKIVLEEIDKVFKLGTKIIVLEAPVGSGKSAIAITLAKAEGIQTGTGVGGTHIITPRKSLQDQYFSDFSKDVVLMKGRNAYPCTFEAPPREYVAVVKAIREGKIKQPDKHSPNCAEAPCKGDTDIYQICTEGRDCPYVLAISIAQEHGIVIHNLHSFIYQSNFGGRFDARGLLIVDEAHEIENTIRGFITKKVVINKVLKKEASQEFTTLAQWNQYLLNPTFVPEETERDRNLKAQDKTFVSAKEEYLRSVEELTGKDYFDKGFSVEWIPIIKSGTQTQVATAFEFIPHYVGGAVRNMLLDYGQKVLLMSGTIYNKDLFCRNLGIAPEEAHFIRIGSSFPKENRPIYLKSQYQVNTSHALWNENFADLIDVIKKIMLIFKNAKGLIHAPSYAASEQIKNALNDPRVVNHTAHDFLTKLEDFFKEKEPKIFISPVCQQGVDFKEDRARFQIIVRVPYPSTNSKFYEDKVKNDFPWYNYQALVTFGQELGRVNRADSDYGATFLVDERFNKFISRNSKALPTWVKEGMVWK